MQVVAALIVVATLIVMTTGAVPAVLALICALVLAGIIGIATPQELFGGLTHDFAPSRVTALTGASGPRRSLAQ